ncbi:hypothetical protein VPH35_026203 [Triticum aestivum]
MGASEVGGMTVVAVVGSSSACPWDYLGLFVAVKSELRRRGPCGNDDKQRAVYSVVFHGANLVWFLLRISPSEAMLCCPRCRWLSSSRIFMCFCTASAVRVESMFVCSEVGVACSGIRGIDDVCLGRGDDDDVCVLTRQGTLRIGVCGVSFVCAVQRIVMVFARFSAKLTGQFSSAYLMDEANLLPLSQK